MKRPRVVDLVAYRERLAALRLLRAWREALRRQGARPQEDQ